MKASEFSEAEAMITRETSDFTVALDGGPMPGGDPHGPEPEYAAQVGVIISLFALVEGYVPQLLERLTGLSARDAMSIMGTLRNFSNRIELLEAIYAPRGAASDDAVIGSHFVQMFRDANKLRNRYAHATYSTARVAMHLQTFSGDYNKKKPEHLEMTLDDFKTDAGRLRRIICECHALVYRLEISKVLHERLTKLSS